MGVEQCHHRHAHQHERQGVPREPAVVWVLFVLLVLLVLVRVVSDSMQSVLLQAYSGVSGATGVRVRDQTVVVGCVRACLGGWG
jgi:hypothetical protein